MVKNGFALKVIALLFLLTMSSYKASEVDEFRKLVEDSCEGVDVLKWEMTDEERTDKRGSSSTPIRLTPKILGEILNDGSYSSAIKGIAVYFALVILLVLAALVCIVLFFRFCCCCKKYGSADNNKAKIWFYVSAVFLILFVIFFILMVVYISKTNSSYSEMQCAINSIPLDLLDGVENDNYSFLGFQKLRDMLSNFATEISQLSSIKGELDSIKDKNIKALTQDALDSLPSIKNQFGSETTADGAGGNSAPISIENLTDEVNEAIGVEFTIYAEIGEKIHDAAVQGGEFTTGGEEQQIIDSINSAVGYLDDLINPITDQLKSINDQMEEGATYVPIGTYVSLGFGLLLLFLSLGMFVILFFQFSKGKCKNCSFCIRIILIILSFIVFILCIIALVMCVGSTVISSFCAFSEDLLESDDVAATLKDFGLEVTEGETGIVDIISKCIGKNREDADLSHLIGDTGSSADALNEVNVFLDGLTEFEQFKKNITEGELDSLTIVETVKFFDQIKSGELPDHEEALVSVEALNDLIDCGDVSFRLSSTNCTESDKGCQGIATTTSFSPPDCTKDSGEASSLFSNLRSYIEDEQALMTDMTTALSDPTGNTPNAKFRTAKQSFRDIISSFDNVSNSVKNTIATVESFTSGFDKLANCGIVRKEIENLESVLCFTINKDFYLLFVFLIVAMFCLFMMNIFICVSLRCVNEDDEGSYIQDDGDDDFGYNDHEKDKIPI